MSPPKVQIVVLQYNNSQDTVKCLESLGSLDYSNFAVIVIDNASLTEHREKIKEFLNSTHYPLQTTNYSLLTTHSNLGYSGGNNIGLKYALEHGADYALILNNDTTVERDFLAKLVEAGESDPKVGILGPAIIESGIMNHESRRVYGGRIRWLKSELFHDSQFMIHDSNLYVPGTAMLIKRQVFGQVGLLDERYFLYFEDADYCLRARRAGYSLAIVPETIVYHEASSSTRKLGAPLLLYYHYRNALLFNARNSPLWAKLLLPFWSTFIVAKQLIKIALMPAKRQISKAILKGVMDFYRGRFGPISGS